MLRTRSSSHHPDVLLCLGADQGVEGAEGQADHHRPQHVLHEVRHVLGLVCSGELVWPGPRSRVLPPSLTCCC